MTSSFNVYCMLRRSIRSFCVLVNFFFCCVWWACVCRFGRGGAKRRWRTAGSDQRVPPRPKACHGVRTGAISCNIKYTVAASISGICSIVLPSSNLLPSPNAATRPILALKNIWVWVWVFWTYLCTSWASHSGKLTFSSQRYQNCKVTCKSFNVIVCIGFTSYEICRTSVPAFAVCVVLVVLFEPRLRPCNMCFASSNPFIQNPWPAQLDAYRHKVDSLQVQTVCSFLRNFSGRNNGCSSPSDYFTNAKRMLIFSENFRAPFCDLVPFSLCTYIL